MSTVSNLTACTKLFKVLSLTTMYGEVTILRNPQLINFHRHEQNHTKLLQTSLIVTGPGIAFSKSLQNNFCRLSSVMKLLNLPTIRHSRSISWMETCYIKLLRMLFYLYSNNTCKDRGESQLLNTSEQVLHVNQMLSKMLREGKQKIAFKIEKY